MGDEIAPLTPEGFQAATGVSRETVDRLRAYEVLLRRWQHTINLVGPSTLDDPWRRHFLDSAQLFPLAPAGARSWVDVGSGAGFPGLVLALLGAHQTHLVESDARKAAFLREVARATDAPVIVHATRSEAVSRETLGGASADVITARAVAPPGAVFDMTSAVRGSATVYLLLMGREYAGPLTDARNAWKMELDEFPSQSDPSSRVLRIQGVSRGGSSSSAI